MFLQPEVAGVGLNEQDCRRLRIPYRVAVYACWYSSNATSHSALTHFALSLARTLATLLALDELIGRALAMRGDCRRGFFKLLVTTDPSMKILGMRALGEHSSSAIQAVSLMIKEGISARKLADLVHPHPSIVEGVQECVRLLLGNSILKPENFPGLLRVAEWHPPADEPEGTVKKEGKVRTEKIDPTVGKDGLVAGAAEAKVVSA
jgi:dihydrolipoamide dehydrogenase